MKQGGTNKEEQTRRNTKGGKHKELHTMRDTQGGKKEEETHLGTHTRRDILSRTDEDTDGEGSIDGAH